MLPSFMTATTSESTSASPWSWVTKTVVMASSRTIRWISSRISSRSLRSSAESGSSSSRRSRLDHEGAGKRDALLLPARQLARHAVGEARPCEPHRGRASPDARDRPAARRACRDRRRRFPRPMRCGNKRIGLEHHADVATPGRQSCVTSRPLTRMRPAARLLEACNHPQRRGLSAAGGTEQAQDLAFRHGQADIADRGEIAERLAEGVRVQGS